MDWIRVPLDVMDRWKNQLYVASEVVMDVGVPHLYSVIDDIVEEMKLLTEPPKEEK